MYTKKTNTLCFLCDIQSVNDRFHYVPSCTLALDGRGAREMWVYVHQHGAGAVRQAHFTSCCVSQQESSCDKTSPPLLACRNEQSSFPVIDVVDVATSRTAKGHHRMILYIKLHIYCILWGATPFV